VKKLATLLATALLVTAVLGVTGPVAAADGSTAQNASCSWPVTATDATGTQVTVSEEPEGVVVVGAGATQTMWEIGAKDKVVGLWKSPYTTYLEDAADRPNVATQYGYADVEKVLKQDPDLVLLANVQKNSTAEKLREAGVTVYKFHAATSLQDVYAKTTLTGKLVGNCEGAAETVSWMKQEVSKVKAAVTESDSQSIYYPMGQGYTAGPDSFITDVLSTAGARNIVLDGDFSGPTAQVSEEFVVKQNPDWLLATYNPVTANGTPSGREALQPVMSAAVNQTQAYEDGNIVVVNGNYLSQPAPRVVYAMESITKAVHPDAWAEVNSTTTTTESTTSSSAGTTTSADTTATNVGESTTTETSGSSPGFGALAGVVAVLAAALLARRR